jgi:hypothetical protein
MKARIYRPTKTAMQSGRGNTRKWVLEFESQEPKRIDPLMGWVSSGDTQEQIRLRFDSKEEAVAFAEKHGYPYWIEEPHVRRVRPKSYADNFR